MKPTSLEEIIITINEREIIEGGFEYLEQCQKEDNFNEFNVNAFVDEVSDFFTKIFCRKANFFYAII